MDVAILGVGTAARRIAGGCADAGFTIAMVGRDANDVLDAIDDLPASAGDRVDGTTDRASAVEGTDVVVETRTGNVEAARERLAGVEASAPGDALVIAVAGRRPVTAVAVGLREPGRFVGLDFGGEEPAAVVAADPTAEETVERAVAFLEEIGVTPLELGDAHGSVAGRLELAMQVEAVRLLEAGAGEADAIDRAAVRAHGLDAGPLEAADRRGLDAVAEDLEYLAETVGPRFDPPGTLEEKVAAGDLGTSRGRGFYVWDGDTPTEPASDE